MTTTKLSKAEQEELQGYFDRWAAKITPAEVERLIGRFDRHITEAQARRTNLVELLAEMERSSVESLLEVSVSQQRFADACDENWFFYGGRASAKTVAA